MGDGGEVDKSFAGGDVVNQGLGDGGVLGVVCLGWS